MLKSLLLFLPCLVHSAPHRSYPGDRTSDMDGPVYCRKGKVDIMRDEVKNVDEPDFYHYRISDGLDNSKEQYAEFYVEGPASIRFTQFDVKESENCEDDFLQFIGTKFCNLEKPANEYDLMGGSHLFRYRSSADDDHEGFILEVSIKKSSVTTPSPVTTTTTEFVCADQAVIDFFLVQDVTQSYKNDLKHLVHKLPSLFHEMQDTFILPRFGLSTFADKPVRPFGSSRSEDFCYELLNPLTTSRDEAEAAVKKLVIHSGLDWKESQLDALMTASLHEDSNWRTYDFIEHEGQTLPVVRLLVLATDAGYHQAGDGKAVGISLPKNDEGILRCLEEDYPTVSQVTAALRRADVSPLFIVTSDVLPIYSALAEEIEESGVPAFAVALKDDSSDIIQAIRQGLGVLCRKAAVKKLERL